MLTTQSQVRAAFWRDVKIADHNLYSRRKLGAQNAQPADIRMAWVDYVDMLARCGEIRGEGLPAHPDLRAQYPNGWSMLDYVTPAKARAMMAGVTL